MRAFAILAMSMALILHQGQAGAQEASDKTPLPQGNDATVPAPRRVTLGRPEPIAEVRSESAEGLSTPKLVRVNRQLLAPVVRAQAPPPPPPPPASPFGGAPAAAGPSL